MLKKILSVLFLLMLFLVNFLLSPKDDNIRIKEVISPSEFLLYSGEKISLNNIDFFDSYYSGKNREFAEKLNISEDQAFIIGNLSKYWAENILKGKKVYFDKDDIVYNRINYKSKFQNSAFFVNNNDIANKEQFEKLLKTINPKKYVIADLTTDTIYPVSKENAQKIKNFVVVRKSHIKKPKKNVKKNTGFIPKLHFKNVLDLGFIKIIYADYTQKLKPDKNCSSEICKELLYQINNSQNSIDIAIYGYLSTPRIEESIKQALKRGVKIRLVYDLDKKGENIYENTSLLASILTDNMNDFNSKENSNIMHNKFYIFDNKIVVTGSANLSHTDMSGFNSNIIAVIKSPEIAKIYSEEFEQMFSGKFHNSKEKVQKNPINGIRVYFSPKDNTIENAIIPIIKNSKKYIYIPTFFITDTKLVNELILAKKRGVDVKIIADALNSSNRSSKQKLLRESGIMLKTENYAGKMHSKSIIADDEYLVIGSMNFSNTGNTKNDENLIVIKNHQAAKFYKDYFLYLWDIIPDKWLKYNARAEGFDSIGSCTDGIDNDYDGYTDKDDPACKEKK